MSTTPPTRVIEVVSGVHAVSCEDFVWAYLLVDRDRVTIVDTGIPGSAGALLETLAAVGRKPGDVREVVLTHYHGDHMGSAAALLERTGAQCVAHTLDADVARGDRAEDVALISDLERPFYEEATASGVKAQRCRVDREVEEGDEIEFAGASRVIHIPGHTPGSIGIHIPSLSTVILGDAAARFQGHLIVGAFNADPPQAVASMRKVALLDFEVACFGHGDPITEGASAAFRKLAARLPN
jgi:glyoxylase-like metal-dependent hydrolase (beta-lactamase superfamily II)